MAFHHDPLQSEQTCTVMAGRRKIGLQPPEQWQGQRSDRPAQQVAIEQRI
ncbi:hypothetical protein APX70_04488, partial [Pseudomonas syringae pv. maculicola]